MARQSKTILKGALQLAVMGGVLGSNPVRDVTTIESKSRPKGAAALTPERLRDLLGRLRADDYCQRHDLVDPITLFIATGTRRSELLGELWTDFDEGAGTISVTGKIVRVKGKGLVRIDDTKSDAGKRTLQLPRFAIEMLQQRRIPPFLGQQDVIFPSSMGTLRDPNNFGSSGAWSVISSGCLA